ncbi:MAG: hypothetical protein J07HQX50_00624, partial [Haloquadratum sp. J07HQX50]
MTISEGFSTANAPSKSSRDIFRTIHCGASR